jgi:hypothetical protein
LCLLYFTSFYFLNNGEKIFLLNKKIYPTGNNSTTTVTHIARHCSFCCFKKRIQVDLCRRIIWMNFLSILKVWFWGRLKRFQSIWKLTHCIFTNMLCMASVVKYIFI